MTLPYLYAVALFLLGLFAGQILNTISLRWPSGIPLSSPNHCPRCNAQLHPLDLIPLYSYLRQHGKCHTCEGKIHPRYPAAELLTAILWASTGWTLASLPHHPVVNALHGVLVLAFISVMILIALIDLDTLTIPDALTHTGLIVSLLAAPLLPQLHHAQTPETFSRHHPFLSHLLPAQQPWQHSIAAALIGSFAGLALSSLIYVLGNIVFKTQIMRARQTSAIGVGDIKLMVFTGAFLGWKSVFIVFATGAIIGAGFGTLRKVYTGRSRNATGWAGLREKWRSGVSTIPFGPFLAVGAILYLIVGPELEKIFGISGL